MSQKTNWMSGTRIGQLAIAWDWQSVLGTKAVVWGIPADPANKGYWIWYNVAASGEMPSTNPEDIHKSFFTKRKKDVIDFGDSGKTVYFAVQMENNGKKGNWGSLVSALIP